MKKFLALAASSALVASLLPIATAEAASAATLRSRYRRNYDTKSDQILYRACVGQTGNNLLRCRQRQKARANVQTDRTNVNAHMRLYQRINQREETERTNIRLRRSVDNRSNRRTTRGAWQQRLTGNSRTGRRSTLNTQRSERLQCMYETNLRLRSACLDNVSNKYRNQQSHRTD